MVDVHDYAAMMEHQKKVFDRLAKYDGNFEFLLEMKALAETDNYVFSERQMAAIEKSLDAWEARKNGATQTFKPVLGDRVPAGTTRHAVVNAEGTLTFIRIDKVVDPENKWNGWVFVKHILGPQEIRLGAQKPNGEYRGQWESLLRQIDQSPIDTLKAYGREIGACGVCGLRLTDELSRELGIGPICRGKL